MASYSPSFIFSPGISVTMAGNITYDQFIGSLSANVHIINSIWVSAGTLDQLNQAMAYSIFDAAGNQAGQIIPMICDPYRYQTALVLPKPAFGMVLNGQSSITFTVLPGQTVQMIFCTDVISFAKKLDPLAKSNFDAIGMNPTKNISTACP